MVKRRTFLQALRETERWKDRRAMISSKFWYIPKYRLENRILDGWAVLMGACNRSTWTGVPPTGYAGGYSHWRCGKHRGHRGDHRYQNYTWSGELHERVKYHPLPVTNPDGTFYDARAVIPFTTVTKRRRPIERRSRDRILWEMEQAAREARAARTKNPL